MLVELDGIAQRRILGRLREERNLAVASPPVLAAVTAILRPNGFDDALGIDALVNVQTDRRHLK